MTSLVIIGMVSCFKKNFCKVGMAVVATGEGITDILLRVMDYWAL